MFPTHSHQGVRFIEAAADAAFRKALKDGCPPQLRSKMHEALSDIPGKGAMAHSVRYFGKELADIKNRIAPLLFELEGYMRNRLDLHGFWEWLDLTNFGNHYKLIKVLDQWAQMAAKDDGQGRKGAAFRAAMVSVLGRPKD